jgi:chemotaxis regulatin CheY-phosphate phosphatase CheZ
MRTDSEVATAEQLPDCQSRLDKIEYLIGVYRMRYMHYVWRDHMPEAGEMERKIDRLLERWQRVRNREIAGARS